MFSSTLSMSISTFGSSHGKFSTRTFSRKLALFCRVLLPNMLFWKLT